MSTPARTSNRSSTVPPKPSRFEWLLKELDVEHRREMASVAGVGDEAADGNSLRPPDDMWQVTFEHDALNQVTLRSSKSDASRVVFAVENDQWPADGELHHGPPPTMAALKSPLRNKGVVAQDEEEPPTDSSSMLPPTDSSSMLSSDIAKGRSISNSAKLEAPVKRLSRASDMATQSSTSVAGRSSLQAQVSSRTKGRAVYEVKPFLILDDDFTPEDGYARLSSAHVSNVFSDPVAKLLSGTRGLSIFKFSRRCFPVHPESKANTAWTCLGMSLLLYDVVMIPAIQAFHLESNPFFMVMSLVICAFWTLDILRASMCAFYENGVLVYELRAIFLNYLRTWLLFDLMLVVFDWFLVIDGDRFFNSVEQTLRSAKIVRLVRMAKMLNFVRAIEERFSTEYVAVIWTIAKQFIGFVILNHFLACWWYHIGSSGGGVTWVNKYIHVDASFAYRYCSSMHWAFAHFINTNLEIYPTNLWERVYELFVILLGLLVASAFVSSITSAIVHLGDLRKKQSKQLWMLRKYLANTGVSTSLVIQIQNFCESAIQRTEEMLSEEQVEILKVLSTPLRRELRVAQSLPVLRRHGVFRFITEMERHTIVKICDAAVRKVMLLQDDHAFNVGDTCNAAYFVVDSDFTYELRFAAHRSEACTSRHFQRSDLLSSTFITVWCEAGLWTTWTHTGTLRSDADSEVLLVDSETFCESISNVMFAELFSSLSKYATDFVLQLNLSKAADDSFCIEEPEEFKLKVPRYSSHTSEGGRKLTYQSCSSNPHFFLSTLSSHSRSDIKPSSYGQRKLSNVVAVSSVS